MLRAFHRHVMKPGLGPTIYAAILRWATWSLVALAAVLLAAFVELSDELSNGTRTAGEQGGLDADLLRLFASLRRPWLNGVAMDMTALGSPLVVALFTVVATALLLTTNDRRGAAFLLASSFASAILTAGLKEILERPRPEIVSKLVQVASLSYPSGHSLASAAVYLTAALVIARKLSSAAQRSLALGFASALVLMIGASRIYLGVHYPSDVVGGILVGTAVALLAAALLRKMEAPAHRVLA